MKYALKAEFIKFHEKFIHEPFSLLPMLGFLYIFFWIITLSAHAMDVSGENMKVLVAYNMLGYIVWFFTISAISILPQALQEERVQGTYEHLNLSTTGINNILIARSITSTLNNLIIIFVFSVLIILIHGIQIFNITTGIVVLIVAVPGLYGFAFLLTGILQRFRQSGSWLGILNFVIIIPLILQQNVIPTSIKKILSFWPVYQSSVVLRMINMSGQSLYDVKGDLLILLISSVGFFILGLMMFSLSTRYAEKLGLLGQY